MTDLEMAKKILNLRQAVRKARGEKKRELEGQLAKLEIDFARRPCPVELVWPDAESHGNRYLDE